MKVLGIYSNKHYQSWFVPTELSINLICYCHPHRLALSSQSSCYNTLVKGECLAEEHVNLHSVRHPHFTSLRTARGAGGDRHFNGM